MINSVFEQEAKTRARLDTAADDEVGLVSGLVCAETLRDSGLKQTNV